jgi:TolA-binding protein
MRRELVWIALLLFGLAAAVPGQSSNSEDGTSILKDGIEAFQDAQYEQALVTFRELLVDGDYQAVRGDARFWIAKSAMALGRLEEAQKQLEHFLMNHPENSNYPEGRYQKGRLFYLQGKYQKAVQAFSRFVEEFPDSAFVANAYYWSGESLFELGQLERAGEMFRTVVRDYPQSYRVEAAEYRLSVLDLHTREQELLKLLQWSHERYLRAVSDFETRKQTFEEALQSYRDRLARLSDEDFRSEIERLRSRVDELERQLSQARRAAQQAEEDEGAEPGTATTVSESAAQKQERLLSLKQQALAVKERIVRQLAQRQNEEGNQ